MKGRVLTSEKNPVLLKVVVLSKKPYLGIVAFFALLLTLLLPAQVFAAPARSSYYDFGPYYGSKQQVLGVTLSSLEQLPVPQIPPQAQIPQATGILPGSPFHPFETFIENVQLTFTIDPIKREELRLGIAAERLSEAKTLIDQGKVDLANDTVASYKNIMNTVSKNMEELAEKNVTGADSLVTKVETATATQSIAAQTLALASPPVIAQAWAQVVDVTEQSMDRAADSANKPAISDDLSASIQELKEKGLITPEESSKLYGFDSRTKVREELDKLASAGQFPIAEITRLDEAVASRFPDAYRQTVNVWQFAELRTYQILPQPDTQTQTAVRRWEEGPADTPPPAEIRPYLYYSRAQDLAENLNFTGFTPAQQTEVSKFYPQAVSKNPTFVPPSATPSVVEGSTTPAGESTTTPSTVSPSGEPSGEGAGQPLLSTPSAQPYLTNYQGSLPGEFGYFFKQFGEGWSSLTTFDPARRVELNLRYVQERLSEATALANDPKRANLYQDTLERYQDSMENLASQVKDFGGPEDKQRELAENLERAAARHTIVLEKGLLTVPSEDPQIYQRVIETAEKAMDVSADVLDKPALPAALSNRLQDLKAQGLILPEEVDKLTQAGSREEVRQIVRDLTKEGIFPPADAKKLDEAQSLVSFSDYNQLVEVRKVEELQGLRAVQGQLAQTPTLKTQADNLSLREKLLTQTIDTSFIRPEDLAGRADLAAVYQTLQATASARPINRGQFGDQPPPPARVALSVCPAGATFDSSDGCIWVDSGKKINDFNQYRCDKAGHYYSFPAQKCVPNQSGKGFGDDSKPVCPVGYAWVWSSQSCQKSTGKRVDPKYSCPDLQYYSPNEEKCVPVPDPGDPIPSACSEQGTYWSFSEQKCIAWPKEGEGKFKDLKVPQPVFVTPGNPFYPVKGWGEFVQRTFAFTPERRQAVTLDQAKERLAEAADALKKDNKEGVKKAIAAYTSAMQDIVADVSKGSFNEQAKIEISKMLGEESVEQNLLISKLSAWADEEEDAVLNAATSVTILGIDKAADLSGEPVIPDDVKAKIESLPKDMISDEDKKKLLELDSRVEARIELNNLKAIGGLTQNDVAFIDEDFTAVDAGTSVEIEELKKLAELADITEQKKQLTEKVEKNEEIVQKLDEFQKTFEVGKEIPADVRPYVRLTRIDEVAQTVRPDVVILNDFQNRKDVVLAVATLQQEFKPTRESFRQVEDFRRRNPNAALPLELARIEALAARLGVRTTAEACYLPSPPFSANTPCPAPGAAIQITSYYTDVPRLIVDPVGFKGGGTWDSEGNRLVYGQGPKPESAGVCPDGYHWMYDSGGWCMSNSGSYGQSYSSPGGYGPGYTPYSPYYTAPGAPGGTYPGSPYPYSPPNYYGVAPTYYTTNPPAGTVPGSGPSPTAPGQCPTGYHWMSDSGGWCMANGDTYVPSGTTPPYSPNLNKSSCGPGYYWDGRGCIPTSGGGGDGGSTPWCWSAFPPPGGWSCESGSSWNSSTCSCQPIYRSGPFNVTSCYPPASGCGYNAYWDLNSCSCRNVSTYPGGPGPTPGNSCQGLSCGGGTYLDYSTCSCRYPSSPGSPGYPGSPNPSCPPPAGGCGSGWFDSSSCSCKQASPQGCYNVSASSCGSGFYWDSSACTCRSNTSTPSTPSSGGGSTSSGSCPSGYHWMSDNGGWCMSDSSSGGGTTSPSPDTSTTTTTPTTTTSEPAPAPAPSEQAPAPAPSEPAPASSPSP